MKSGATRWSARRRTRTVNGPTGWARRAFLLASCLIALQGTVMAYQIDLGLGLRAEAPSRSMKALRDQNVVRQQLDFSCGAAALATILQFGFGHTVGERELLDELFRVLPAEERAVRRTIGFSLLDLQRVARVRGFDAQGFRLQPEQLSMLTAPVIVYIEPRGYPHFAVLRGIRGDRVYLADPSRGNIRMPMYSFLETWVQDDGTGVIFAVQPASGGPASIAAPLPLAVDDIRQPEVMTAREMLWVGNPLARLPEWGR